MSFAIRRMPAGGISDQELLERLGVFYNEVQVSEIVKEMEDAAVVRLRDEFEMPPVDEMGMPLSTVEELAMAQQQAARRVEEIRSRFTRRMHDLSEFMKSLLERFTKCFNRMHSRSGTLWEDRFKNVIVESGTAARTIAAYIDLNPVRAGMVNDPAEMLESKGNGTVLKDLGMAKMLRYRMRYFTDGAVIGSKEFVNEAFAGAREWFGPKRKDGARAMGGSGSGAKVQLWSKRDLRVRV